MDSQLQGNAIEVFLQPGEYYFSGPDTRIRTVLGSCVSIVFWHPHRRLGGMCHYMLPTRPDRPFGELDGRYADEAAALIFREMRENGTQPREYEVKVFGGANMFPNHRTNSADQVGMRNAEAARAIISAHQLTCVSEHLNGIGHRNIIFDVWSGTVWVRYHPLATPERAAVRAPALQLCAA
jgi:chemotaxis protein CheD